MIYRMSKSLDRPVDIFGLKGEWIKVFLIVAACFLVAGFVAGAMTTSGIGITVVIVGCIGSFVTCLVVQDSVPHRNINKYSQSAAMKSCVRRKETISHIMLPDPRYQRLKIMEEADIS